MKLKDSLEEIKILIKDNSTKTNKEITELKAEIDILQNKMNKQNTRFETLSNKIEELKKDYIESTTLLEEIAYCLLEDEQNLPIQNEGDDELFAVNVKEKYIN